MHFTKCSKIFRAYCGDRNLHSWITFVNINLNEIKLVNAVRVHIGTSGTFKASLSGMWFVSWWQSGEHPLDCQKRITNCCAFTPENMKRECNTLSDEEWIWLRSKRTFHDTIYDGVDRRTSESDVYVVVNFFFQLNLFPLFCVHYHTLAHTKTKEN